MTPNTRKSPQSIANRPTDIMGDLGRGAHPFGFLVLVKVIDHEQLLAQYQHFHGETAGALALQGQFSDIFREARWRAGIATGSFASWVGGFHFTTQFSEE